MGAKRRRGKNHSRPAGISPSSGNDRRKTSATGLSAVQERWRREPVAIAGLVLATIACLLPFVGKAVHMDDPLFIWAARQMQSRWWDPYGFNLNWYGTLTPMHEVTMNPPLASAYLALLLTISNGAE